MKSFEPYFLCNEQGCESTLEAIDRLPKNNPRAVHVGFSVGFNLDVLAKARPALALIFDIDQNVLELYQQLNKTILESETQEIFIEKLQKYLLGKDWFPGLDLKKEAERTGSWLSTADNYNHVRQMHIDGKILYGCLNLADKEKLFEKIADWLRRGNFYVQTLYISNILEWLRRSSREAFDQGVHNIKTLCSQDTRCIHAYCLEGNEKVFPTQIMLPYPELPRLEEAWAPRRKRPASSSSEGEPPPKIPKFFE